LPRTVNSQHEVHWTIYSNHCKYSREVA
jgi:hypothetical protein